MSCAARPTTSSISKICGTSSAANRGRTGRISTRTRTTISTEVEPGLPEPPTDCRRCERLAAFRDDWKAREPAWACAPAPSFGPENARLLIVGLAPGLRGANRTGRPFTGDGSGAPLFAALNAAGFSRGAYGGAADDGVTMVDAIITNAVRCAPPANRPTAAEIARCRPFLAARIQTAPALSAILCLGRVAHDSVARALGASPSALPFSHGAEHLAPQDGRALRVFDSFHCSRYNMNTGRLTQKMLDDVVARIRRRLEDEPPPLSGGDDRVKG